MSLGRRLINIARAELKDAARKLLDSTEEILGGSHEDRRSSPHDQDHREADPETPRAAAHGEPEEPAQIRKFYANLELPIGAGPAEVKAAYRRMMRRYHPDRHQNDPQRVEAATRLATELRTAYEGLLKYLESQGRT